MSSNASVLKGVIHGRMIELENEPGLPDGQSVTVMVQAFGEKGRLPAGEGIRRSAGAWADDPKGLDEYLVQVRQEREPARSPIEP
jgi:hypothetical protein